MLFIAQYQAARLAGDLTAPPSDDDAVLGARVTPPDDQLEDRVFVGA